MALCPSGTEKPRGTCGSNCWEEAHLAGWWRPGLGSEPLLLRWHKCYRSQALLSVMSRFLTFPAKNWMRYRGKVAGKQFINEKVYPKNLEWAEQKKEIKRYWLSRTWSFYPFFPLEWALGMRPLDWHLWLTRGYYLIFLDHSCSFPEFSLCIPGSSGDSYANYTQMAWRSRQWEWPGKGVCLGRKVIGPFGKDHQTLLLNSCSIEKTENLTCSAITKIQVSSVPKCRLLGCANLVRHWPNKKLIDYFTQRIFWGWHLYFSADV